MKKNIFTLIIFIISIILLGFVVKGDIGTPIYYQNEKDSRVGGLFESTNTNSRYSLVEAIVENKSFFFTDEQAKFSAPDIVLHNSNYFSIFTPGVSFVAIPFYMLGKIFDLPQLFTFFSTLIFAILNIYLVFKIGQKLGAGRYTAIIGGLVFIFATNALSYSLTLTQHHASTTLILLSVLNALSQRTWFNNLMLGVIFSAAILMDIPNAFMMLPVLIYVVFRHFKLEDLGKKIKIAFDVSSMFILIGIIPLIFLFGWYNYSLTGSYTTLGQMIGRTDYVEGGRFQPQEKVEEPESPYDRKHVFDPRSQMNGLYILIISNERGILFYSPIVAVGLLGLWIASKKRETLYAVILTSSVAMMCVVVYSMFGDPWGGWSYGPRYLIPAAALFCGAIGVAIEKLNKNPVFVFVFASLLIYSVWVSSLGAMTTNSIPPRVEAINLSSPIPYTYQYNLNFLEDQKSSSLIFNIFFYKYISLGGFLIAYISAISILISVIYVMTLRSERD